MKIILLGIPQSTNHIYKSHCRFGYPTVYMTKEGKDLKESYQWQAKSQWKQKPSKRVFEISVELYFKDKRRRDVDDYNKILLDSLTGIVWSDDSQIWKITITKFIDAKKPRIEVDITEVL